MAWNTLNSNKLKRLGFVFLLLNSFFVSCQFSGEMHSICNIDFNSVKYTGEEIIDSLLLLEPEFKQSVQEKYSYNTDGTGYVSHNLYFWNRGVHYVISSSYYSNDIMRRIKITNFGIDGDVLKKYDSLNEEEVLIAKEIIRNKLLTELENHFPEITFSCDCG